MTLLRRETLEGLGYTVIEAGHGGQALVLAEQHAGRLDLLLTDVIMPHMSGPELANRLAPLHPETRVLCMSGYTGEVIRYNEPLTPGLFLLQKPFTPEMLARKVREVLDHPGSG